VIAFNIKEEIKSRRKNRQRLFNNLYLPLVGHLPTSPKASLYWPQSKIEQAGTRTYPSDYV